MSKYKRFRELPVVRHLRWAWWRFWAFVEFRDLPHYVKRELKLIWKGQL